MCVDGSLVYDLSPRAHRLEYTYIKVIVDYYFKKKVCAKKWVARLVILFLHLSIKDIFVSFLEVLIS